MSRSFVKIARAAYRTIPYQPLRSLVYSTFARLVRNRRTVATIEGVTFDLDLGELIDLSLYLRQYEPDVTAAIHAHTVAGMTVLDIGANIGAHALLFASLVGPSGRVFAFEPTDFAYAKLSRNVSLNAALRVEPVKLALSDHVAPPERVNFRSSWRTDGGRHDGESVAAFDTLDAWCGRNGVDRVDLVKVDVDGNEFPLIRGGLATLDRFRPLMLMEAVGPHFDDRQRNPFLLLREIGYSFNQLMTGEEISIERLASLLPRNDSAMTKSLNVLATNKGR